MSQLQDKLPAIWSGQESSWSPLSEMIDADPLPYESEEPVRASAVIGRRFPITYTSSTHPYNWITAIVPLVAPLRSENYAKTTTITVKEEELLPEEGFEGFLATSCVRDEIFEQQITIKTSEIPRWRIAVRLDPHLVDEDD